MPVSNTLLNLHWLTFTSFIFTFLVSTTLRAGEITSFTWSSGIASVALDPIVPPVAPNNDDIVGTSPNEIRITQKDYVGIGPVDIEFTVIPSGGVTEYLFTEGVQNGTGIPWTDYHMQLGFGVGSAFVPSPPGDGLDFDDGVSATSPFSFSPFTTVIVTEDDIDAFGGVIVSPSFTFPFVFHIDVPDGITTFTLRQYPTTDFIPEPSSLVLSSLALLAPASTRKRKKQMS